MAHLLPPAGIDIIQKGDQFRFHNVRPGENEHCGHCEDIPLNIHDYKWTDYAEEDRFCREQQIEESRFQKQQMRCRHAMQSTMRAAPQAGCASCPTQLNWPERQPPAGANCQNPQGGCTRCLCPPDCASRPASVGAKCQCRNPNCPCGARRSGVAPPDGGWGYCPPICVDPQTLIRPRDMSLPDSTRPTGAPYFTQECKKSCCPAEPPLAEKGGFNYEDWHATQDQRLPPGYARGQCVPTLCTWCGPQYVDCCPDMNNPAAYTIVKPPP